MYTCELLRWNSLGKGGKFLSQKSLQIDGNLHLLQKVQYNFQMYTQNISIMSIVQYTALYTSESYALDGIFCPFQDILEITLNYLTYPAKFTVSENFSDYCLPPI